jgi:hypothetical protein
MNESQIVTYEEFKNVKNELYTVKKDVDWLKDQNTDTRIWQARYGEIISNIQGKMSDIERKIETYQVEIKTQFEILGDELRAQTSKPARRWELLITSLITGAVGIAATLIATKLA